METEWPEDSTHEAMRPAGHRTRARQGSEEPYVATKPGNAGGAKGSREMDVEWTDERKTNRRQCLAVPAGLSKPKRSDRVGDGSNRPSGLFAC